MLTPEFYESYDPLPQSPVWPVVGNALRVWMRSVGFRVEVEGDVPRQPALLCTNSTQRHDFLALMKAFDQAGQRVVTVSKAKNFHSAAMSFVMKRTGVIPIASRGYVAAVDFRALFGRRPTNDEYRAVRDHIDRDAPLPDALRALAERPRDIVGVPFYPSMRSYREQVQRVYAKSLEHTARLARLAVDAGYHVQIYPEGTVSPQLGVGRVGAMQLARALGLVMVPVGMSGCPDAFIADTPLPKRGTIRVRVGAPIDLAALLPADHEPFAPGDEQRNRAPLLRATGILMDRIEALLDERYRRPRGAAADAAAAALSSKGAHAFL